MPRRPPLVIGHRGAPGYRPEHTRSCYEIALATGVDAVEPDVVVSRDGVLVVRHENEVSTTTDIAERPEFARRRTTKRIDGKDVTGWFTEDFTWDELERLRCRERLPGLRASSAEHDRCEPILRLADVLGLVSEASRAQQRPIGVVLEIKHATYFARAGLDPVPLIAEELRAAGWQNGELPLVIEAFELAPLDRLRREGIDARYVFLMQAEGAPQDLVETQGMAASDFAYFASPEGIATLAGRVDGISLDKTMILGKEGSASGGRIVADAHRHDLEVFTWTCRPENAFLARPFRSGAGKGARGDYAGEWGVLRDTGLDGVFVDHPDLGVEFFRAGAEADA